MVEHIGLLVIDSSADKNRLDQLSRGIVAQRAWSPRQKGQFYRLV